MEDQPTHLTEWQIEEGYEEVPLSERNTELLDCLAHFIKYNTFLVHLDLRSIGLIEPAMKYLVSFLNKAQALQSLHLGGNEAITPKVVDWIGKRINGFMKPPDVTVPPMNK